MSVWRRRWTLLVALICACEATGLDDALPLAEADLGAFEAMAQPVLARHCANPSCHGRPGPLQIYAERLHRRDPTLNMRSTPLEEAELRHNLRECLARVDRQQVDASRLLTMTRLPAATGGAGGHAFGRVFEDIDEPGYQALRAWAWLASGKVAP